MKVLKSAKLYLAIIAALIILVAASIAVVAFKAPRAAYAAGELGDHNANPTINMVLDINGQDAIFNSSLLPANFDLLENGGQNNLYRSRVLNFEAVRTRLDEIYNPTGTPSFAGAEYIDGSLYNSDGRYVTAVLETVAAEPGVPRGVRLTAAPTDPLKSPQVTDNARVVFKMRNTNDGNEYTVNIKIKIAATFAHAYKTVNQDGSGGREFPRTGDLYVGADNSTNELAYIEIQNATFNPEKVDLSNLLKNKRLFTLDADTVDSFSVVRPGYGAARTGEWMLSDISKLHVKSAGVIGGNGLNITVNVTSSPEALFTPFITVTSDIDQSKVDTTLDPLAPYPDIFMPNSFIPLRVVFGSGSSPDNDISVIVRLRILKSAAPIQKQFNFPTSLNAALSAGENNDYYFDSAVNTYSVNSTASYRKVRVYADDLANYASTHDQNFPLGLMNSVANYADINDKAVSLSEGAEGDRRYVDIEANSNGNVKVIFNLIYGTDRVDINQNDPMQINVDFRVYGVYTLATIDASGRKQWTKSVNNWSLLNEVYDAGFYVVDVKQITDNGKGSITFTNNKLSVTPIAAGKETIEFEFSDGKRSIFVTTDVSIDPNAGSLIGNWDPVWQVVLWIGVGLVALLFICLLIWLLIRAASKSKREALETSAPTSSYLIKLNSTIAAAQVQQQRSVGFMQTQAPMLLAAPQTASPGMAMQTVMPSFSDGLTAAPPPPTPDQTVYMQNNYYTQGGYQPSQPLPPTTMGLTQQQVAATTDVFYIPLSDEQLIEKIFVEKYEPRGMTRRSFYKSKDLQARELEKEKQRIRAEVANGKTVEEACGLVSANQPEQASVPFNDQPAPEGVDSKNPLVVLLGFNPYEAVEADMATVTVERQNKIVIDEATGEEKYVYDELTEEDACVETLKMELKKLEIERDMLSERLNKIETEAEGVQLSVQKADEQIELTEKDIFAFGEQITDFEVQMASASKREKERISKEIFATDEKIRSAKAYLAEQQRVKGEAVEAHAALEEISENHTAAFNDKEREVADCKDRLLVAEKRAQSAAELAKKTQEAQKQSAQSQHLKPVMQEVYYLDLAVRNLQNNLDNNSAEMSELKKQVSTLQAQLLSTTDPVVIPKINEAIVEKNSKITELNAQIAADTKEKSEKAIELSSQRKKANDFISKEDIPADKVSEIENETIRNIVYENYKQKLIADKAAAEAKVDELRNAYDELSGKSDTDVTEAAMSLANEVSALTDAINESQKELDGLKERMETASDDDKLNMSIEQLELDERIESLNKMLEETKANGIKSNLELKMKNEDALNKAAEDRDKAIEEYEKISALLDKVIDSEKNPEEVASIADPMFTSGSGLISQDRQSIEENNLKKQLEHSKNQVEQAQLAAQMAKMEAERLLIEAERASIANKAELDRIADEAVKNAEKARKEAEAQVAEETRRALEEAELAKREATEDAERARREAMETTERIKEEAERAKRETAEDAERAKREALEEAERARREAAEEIERVKNDAEMTKLSALDEVEKTKRAAEAEMERVRLDAATDQMKQGTLSSEEEARIAAKVHYRKQQIAALRRNLREISNEKDAEALKEKFYEVQLSLDEDEKKSAELKELLDRSMNDASHAAELARYKELAGRKPQRVVKKVTERVNKIPRPGQRPQGQRSRNVTNVHNVTRVAGQRPAGARPGARPPQRPGGARPAGARPGARPPQRPGGQPPRRPGY